MVELEDGHSIAMDSLRVGDRVRSSENGTFSDVYLFSHDDRSLSSTFVRMETSPGWTIDLSDGHYIYLNGEPKTAGHARVGDTLTTFNGNPSKISNVQRVTGKGLYNPQTLDGNIVVNGFLVTTWTSAVRPRTATALLAPVRFPYVLLPPMARSFVIDRITPLIRYARDWRIVTFLCARASPL